MVETMDGINLRLLLGGDSEYPPFRTVSTFSNISPLGLIQWYATQLRNTSQTRTQSFPICILSHINLWCLNEFTSAAATTFLASSLRPA